MRGVTEPDVLEAVNKWVGVVIALVGSVVVAPAGTGLLLGSSWTGLRRRGSLVRGQLSRILPFLGSSADVPETVTGRIGGMSGPVTVTARGLRNSQDLWIGVPR